MQFSPSRPVGYQELCSDNFIYNGDLPPAAVEVMAKMAISESVNTALTNKILAELKKPEVAQLLHGATSFVYTVDPAETREIPNMGKIILIPYKIWFK